MTWTNEKLDRLRQMWSAGAPASKIGVEIGFSRSAVLGKLHRLKLAKRRIKDRPARHPGRSMAAKPAAPKPAQTRVVASAPVVAVRAPEGANRAEMMTVYDIAIHGDPAMVGRPMIGAPREQCRWPIDGEVPRLCCSAPVDGDLPYCPDHARIAYTPRRGFVERPDALARRGSAW